MSQVTSVVILASIMEDESHDDHEGQTLQQINTFAGFRGARMEEISESAGGNKAMQATIYAGAFNYLDDDAFIEHLRKVEWEEPESVRVFFNGEHDDGWTEIDIKRKTIVGRPEPYLLPIVGRTTYGGTITVECSNHDEAEKAAAELQQIADEIRKHFPA